MDSRWKFSSSKILFSRCWYTNSSFSFGGINQPTKYKFSSHRRIQWNFLDSRWKFSNCKIGLGGAGTQTSALAFGGGESIQMF
jgi:hypothetical protein